MAKIIAGFMVLLALVSCSTPEPKTKDQTSQEPQKPAATEEVKQPAQNEWDKILEEFEKKTKVAKQEAEFQAEEHFKLAEKYFQAADLEKAEAECLNALRFNPAHTSAKALLNEIYIQQDKGVATAESELYAKIMEQIVARQQQIKSEITHAVATGRRYFDLGEYEKAEHEFKKIIEYTKWIFPLTADIETQQKMAVELLKRTRDAKKQREIDEQKLRQRLVEEEIIKQTIISDLERKKELEIMLGQAQLYFQREEYDKCILICDKMLHINPNLSSVHEMRTVAQRLKYMKLDKDYLEKYVEEFKRARANIEAMATPPEDLIEFANRETWEEIRKRGVREAAPEEKITDADKSILERLRSIRYPFTFSNTSLVELVEQLREYTAGIDFQIDKAVESPDEKRIPPSQYPEISVDRLLDLVLPQFNLKYYVEGGFVIITTEEQYDQKRIRLKFYPVDDLVYSVPDFFGPEVTITSEGFQQTTPTEPAPPPFNEEELANLIKSTIDNKTWDKENRQISSQKGFLIAKNTIDVHKKIAKFLSDLRAATGVIVSMEARFLWVTDSFLQLVGMDFRDLRADQFGTNLRSNEFQRFLGFPYTQLNDINPSFFAANPFFLNPSPATSATSPGLVYQGTGGSVREYMGARVQNIMINDLLRRSFERQFISSLGGALLQYVLVDDITIEALMRFVSKSEKGHLLNAPRITLFNGQRGYIQISNQFTYVKDWNIQVAGVQALPDPQVDVAQDGIILDVRPIVSADRRYVTAEIRATVANLFPPPPRLSTLSFTTIVVTAQGGFLALPFNLELPAIHMQQIKTTVVIPDEGTLVIGGLAQYFDLKSESSIPIWRNIPLLGMLGSETVKGKGRRQLLIILKSRIIIPSEIERKLFD